MTNKPATAKIIKLSDFSLTFLVFKIYLTTLQNSLTFHGPYFFSNLPNFSSCSYKSEQASNQHTVCAVIRILKTHHWCSLETVKFQPEGPPFKWEMRLCRVSHLNGGPEGWDLLSPMNTND